MINHALEVLSAVLHRTSSVCDGVCGQCQACVDSMGSNEDAPIYIYIPAVYIQYSTQVPLPLVMRSGDGYARRPHSARNRSVLNLDRFFLCPEGLEPHVMDRLRHITCSRSVTGMADLHSCVRQQSVRLPLDLCAYWQLALGDIHGRAHSLSTAHMPP